MNVEIDRWGVFELDNEFVEPYRDRPVRWGFGALSKIAYERTYSRDGERWWQTCRRVIEGTFTIQRAHCRQMGLPWNEEEAGHLAREAYHRMWSFLWTPPGRGLWIMGTQFLYERGGAALNNCGFVSTRNLSQDYAAPFAWMLHMAMLGVGVGFDTAGRGTVTIEKPRHGGERFTVEDSREGWVEALRTLLGAYRGKNLLPAEWDFSRIRARGERLESFGGRASGPEPLRKMLESLSRLHEAYVGRPVDARLIVDTMNLVGRAVVAGGVRRSAQIAFGEPDDEQFLDLKQDEEKVRDYRWVSNNSVVARTGMDYATVAQRTAHNGEPGYFWLDNARRFGRMMDRPDGRDEAAVGSNPCVEQTLWDKELCCLVETYPAHHESLEDFQRTLRVAYLYAKTVTLVASHDQDTNAVMMRNRRIGCSMTGVVQAVERHGYRRFFQWCDASYRFVQALDREMSGRFAVPRSIKTTSVKPSGTVSILAGATPGVHWDHAPFYLRRVRIGDSHPLVQACRQAGYPVEEDVYSDDTVVIAFPIHVPHASRARARVPLREKIDLAAQMQRYWSDNQVSCTVDFDPDTESDQLAPVLSTYEDRLKAVVFLPSTRHGYAQPPYEEISAEQYREMSSQLKPLRGSLEHEESRETGFCEGGVCELPPIVPDKD